MVFYAVIFALHRGPTMAMFPDIDEIRFDPRTNSFTFYKMSKPVPVTQTLEVRHALEVRMSAMIIKMDFIAICELLALAMRQEELTYELSDIPWKCKFAVPTE